MKRSPTSLVIAGIALLLTAPAEAHGHHHHAHSGQKLLAEQQRFPDFTAVAQFGRVVDTSKISTEFAVAWIPRARPGYESILPTLCDLAATYPADLTVIVISEAPITPPATNLARPRTPLFIQSEPLMEMASKTDQPTVAYMGANHKVIEVTDGWRILDRAESPAMLRLFYPNRNGGDAAWDERLMPKVGQPLPSTIPLLTDANTVGSAPVALLVLPKAELTAALHGDPRAQNVLTLIRDLDRVQSQYQTSIITATIFTETDETFGDERMNSDAHRTYAMDGTAFPWASRCMEPTLIMLSPAWIVTDIATGDYDVWESPLWTNYPWRDPNTRQ